MPTGYLSLVLHAHLPFVRHPEDPTVMEEQWLYEAITGTYLPLIQMFEGLGADGVPCRSTVSLSAPLITMLTDDLLKERYAAHLDHLLELAARELERTAPEPHYHRLARMYADRFQSLRHTWRCHDGKPRARVPPPAGRGRIEVITSTATHAFFPLLDRNWAALRAQVHAAATSTSGTSGDVPPACGSPSAAMCRAWTSCCARRRSATSSSTRTACSSRIGPRCSACTRRSTAGAA
jgi:1,4-alpha-glucan branching enzyme